MPTVDGAIADLDGSVEYVGNAATSARRAERLWKLPVQRSVRHALGPRLCHRAPVGRGPSALSPIGERRA